MDRSHHSEATNRPPAVLVVGMHRSGTSATASALGELGLALPRDEDLLGAQFGNEKGHFESRSLLAFCDSLLERLGRSWDDPPELAPPGSAVDPALTDALERGREVFEAAFEAPERAVVWKDPRACLLLPFWRAALDRPVVALFVLREPAEVARSLQRRNGLGLTFSLALWERYVRHAAAGLDGLPVFVTAFDEALAEPARWQAEVAGFLASAGLETAGSPSAFDPSLRHERVVGDDPVVLPAQRAIADALASLRGPHRSFHATLGEESPWTTSELARHHELARLWVGLKWASGQLARLPRPAPPLPPAADPNGYPKDATDDELGYHRWLRERGEPVTVGHGPGIAPPATPPPPVGERPLFTVVVPTYCTPPDALDRCVSSVLSQSYAGYELRIADDASPDPALRARLAEIAALDRRISIRLLEQNGGISAATNAALEGASGEYVVFLDHDDELATGALATLARAVAAHPDAAVLYSDEDKIDEQGRRFMPAFKPGWSPDLLLSNAYMCHLLVVRRSLLERLGGLRSEFDGAQDYDLMLRATEAVDEHEIVHIPEILYHWRVILGSASGDPSAKPWAFEAGRRAIADALSRRQVDADVVDHPRIPGSYYVLRRVRDTPLVSAIIPFRDEPGLLAACYRAFVDDPGHDRFELLLVDNDSALPETRAVLGELARDARVRVLPAPGPFNWVKINNEAAEKAAGDLLLFLNNDIEARSPGWLGHLVAQAQRPEVGAVGARLLYPDGTVQHGGVAVGVCLGAAHVQQGIDGSRPGYLSGLSIVRNVSAVTGACMMSRREVFEEMGRFDLRLPIAFNDIDYCLRLREAGYLVVYTPLAELVHHESKSRGHTDDLAELPHFRSRWRELMLAGDPYYNPNLGRFDSFCRLPNEEDEERWEIFRSMLNASSTS